MARNERERERHSHLHRHSAAGSRQELGKVVAEWLASSQKRQATVW